jgi:hypothetical protein
VIQLDGEQYWLDAAADSGTNESHYKKLESTRSRFSRAASFESFRETDDVDIAVVLSAGDLSLQ